MLVVSRRMNESMMIGDDLQLTVLEVQSERALIVVSRKAVASWQETTRQWLGVDKTMPLGDDASCLVQRIRGERVRLAFMLPVTVGLHRKEVYEAIHENWGDEPGST